MWRIVEDPSYDDDGVLIDEDDALLAEFEQRERAKELENFDPFDTINS